VPLILECVLAELTLIVIIITLLRIFKTRYFRKGINVHKI